MILTDCSPIDLEEFSTAYFGRAKAAKELATTWLSKLSKKSIQDSQLFKLSENSFDCEPIVYTDRYGQWWVGRYIGSLHFDGISIEIQPRFGLKFIANNIPLNNFIPVEVNASFESGERFIHFLQAMLWLNMLTKAARHSLPTVRLRKEHTSPVSRGRIDVRSTIKSLIKDQSNIVSVSSQKHTNNPVTTSVVLAFFEIQKWFPKHNLLNWLPEVIALRLKQMIEATPRHAAIPKVKEIKKARLGSIAKYYSPLTRLSLDILKNKGISEKISDNESSTLLLDVAELWEIYILDVLHDAFLSEIDVSHGTLEGDKHLLTDQTGSYKLGKLLPDYIFTYKGQTISIGDAKYKRLGDAPWMSPKRDDLYQMTAYLSRYSTCSHACFFYPDWGESCQVSDSNPWRLESGQEINFISVPTEKSEAVALLRNFLLKSRNDSNNYIKDNIDYGL